MITMEELLRTMVERGGSDLHISAGSAPRARIDGDLIEMAGVETLGPDQTKKLVYSVLDQEQIARFDMFEREGWSHEKCTAYLLELARRPPVANAAE